MTLVQNISERDSICTCHFLPICSLFFPLTFHELHAQTSQKNELTFVVVDYWMHEETPAAKASFSTVNRSLDYVR